MFTLFNWLLPFRGGTFFGALQETKVKGLGKFPRKAPFCHLSVSPESSSKGHTNHVALHFLASGLAALAPEALPEQLFRGFFDSV